MIVLPQLDLDCIQERTPAPIVLLGRQRQLFRRLPVRNVEGARSAELAVGSFLHDGIAGEGKVQGEVRIRRIALDDDRLRVSDYMPRGVRAAQRRGRNLGSECRSVMEPD